MKGNHKSAATWLLAIHVTTTDGDEITLLRRTSYGQQSSGRATALIAAAVQEEAWKRKVTVKAWHVASWEREATA